jgi:hypothetical protein
MQTMHVRSPLSALMSLAHHSSETKNPRIKNPHPNPRGLRPQHPKLGGTEWGNPQQRRQRKSRQRIHARAQKRTHWHRGIRNRSRTFSPFSVGSTLEQPRCQQTCMCRAILQLMQSTRTHKPPEAGKANASARQGKHRTTHAHKSQPTATSQLH